jgi:restriction system protein
MCSVSEPRLWGIHNDEFSIDFVSDGVISLGWDLVPDLRRFKGDREALKKELAASYPTAKPGAIPIWSGVLDRFANDMVEGDVVVHPRKTDRTVNLGVVDGGYEYAPDAPTHRHRRSVRWVNTGLLRTAFSQGALYEIGSAVTLFRVRKHDQEFLAALEGGPSEVAEIDSESEELDETSVAEDEPDAERITETTRDFLVRSLATDFKGHPFAHFVAHLLETMGYRTQVSPEGPDRGVDIVAHKDPLGLEPPIIKVQCKSTEGQIGSPDVSGLLGTLGPTELGLVVTLGRFSVDAKNLGRDRPNLRLIDGEELVELIFERYESFSPEYKRKLPMRRVFVPDRAAAS